MEFSNAGEKWNTKLFRTLNSAMSFGIAYILLTIGDFASKSVTARMYSIKGTWFFYGVHYNAELKEWYQKNSVLVHSSGLVFIFFASIISWIIFKNTERIDSPFRLVFLWTSVIGMCIICSQFMTAAFGTSDYNSPYATDFAFAIAWLYIKPAIAFMLAGFMFLVMVASTFFLTTPFLKFAFSYRKVYKLKARRKYFFEVAMIPAFIGVLFSTILIFPEKYIFIHFMQVLYILITMVVCWYMLFYTDVDYDSLSRHTKLEKINFPLFTIFILLTVLTQTILQKGIKF
jgi:hypothetical protein